MIGIKLLHLYRELSLIQKNELRLRSANKADKRYKILHKLLSLKIADLEDLTIELRKIIDSEWPNSSDNDQKFRRLSLFICEQFERVLIDDYLNENSVLKNSLIAKSIERKGNLLLIKHYYDKLYKEAESKNDIGLKIQGLLGKIRMNYASQKESELTEALKRNEELLDILNVDYQKRMVDYFYQCSNIYLEQNHLLAHKKEELHTDILNYVHVVEKPTHRASLYLSLAKLNYDSVDLTNFLQLAKLELNKSTISVSEFEDLTRKIRFLELRLNFFSGKSLEELLTLSENVVGNFENYSIINNNVLFYRILFLILNSDYDKLKDYLNEKTLFFQGEAKILKLFLHALLFEHTGETKKATKILNQIMYGENYLVTVFSRLLFIKILLSKEKSTLLQSSIESTQRIINKNRNNQLGQSGHQFVLDVFKRRVQNSRKPVEFKEPQLNVLHRYLLELKF
jgi:hypothetical protein